MKYIIIGVLLVVLLRRFARLKQMNEETNNEIVAEQIRQAKEQEKLKREQEKQAVQLEKHEKRIADLEFKVEQAERDIEFLYEARGNLDGLNDHYKMLQCGTVPGSKEWIKYQNKIIALDNKTHTIETKMAKAQHIKEMAEQELSA